MVEFHAGNFVNAIVYAFLGIVIFMAAFVITDKVTPVDLWKELIETKNVALAIVVGAMSIGVCIIIAAAVH
jgi:putative membrane protein